VRNHVILNLIQDPSLLRMGAGYPELDSGPA